MVWSAVLVLNVIGAGRVPCTRAKTVRKQGEKIVIQQPMKNHKGSKKSSAVKYLRIHMVVCSDSRFDPAIIYCALNSACGLSSVQTLAPRLRSVRSEEISHDWA